MGNVATLSDYLKAQGVDSSTPLEDIALHKKEYWRLYHQSYYKERKKEQHRFTMRMAKEEYRQLQAYAKKHKDKSFHAFIKESALAYMNQRYVPRDPDAIDGLTKAIRKIGNVINQVVQRIHRTEKWQNLTGGFSEEKSLKKLQREYEFLVKRVTDMEEEVKNYMAVPPKRVGEALWEIVSREPGKIDDIRKLLDEIETKLQSNANH